MGYGHGNSAKAGEFYLSSVLLISVLICSVQDGITALGKAHKHSVLSKRKLLCVARETASGTLDECRQSATASPHTSLNSLVYTVMLCFIFSLDDVSKLSEDL